MSRVWLLCLVCLCSVPAGAKELSYFLPKGVEYDEKIPTPESVLEFQTGERHITHHQLVTYVTKIAELSPRVTIERYAKTHGQRPMLMLTITSAANHKNIDLSLIHISEPTRPY